ncbi:MAG: hypothetical protein AB7F31_03355 [Parachlamydiales bacterium]
MRYALVSDHHHYFKQHGSIAFEGLFTPFVLPEGEGRDLWRGDEAIALLVKSKKLAEVATQLIAVRPLRLLYDQRITLLEGATLEEMSAFQGVVGGWHLDPNGVATFFSKTAPLNLGPGLLVVYGTAGAVYTRNGRDPYRSTLRTLGYDYGDRLNERTHPLVLS